MAKDTDSEDADLTESLTIFLGKEGLKDARDFFKTSAGLREFPIQAGNEPLGTLFIQPRRARMPRWARLFEGQVDAHEFGRASSTAGVFIVPLEHRTVLLTFGQGRHMLKSDSVEDRFGRRVTLNSVGEDRVRSLDKQTFDTLSRHTRVQSSKEARPFELGIDLDLEVLRTFTGTPIDEALGKTLSGVDSLHAIVKVDLSGLHELLNGYVEQFAQDSYKDRFPWIDQITHLEDQALVDELNALLLEAIDDEEFEKCWLAVPEPIDWSHVVGFKYGRAWKQPVHHDISFPTFISTLPADAKIDLPLLLRRDVVCVGADDIDLYTWPVYRCINFEVERKGRTYLLNGGKWYAIMKDLVDQVNDEVKRIPKFGRSLPEYGEETEAEYNARVANGDPKSFALMDLKLIPWGGGNSKFEFCDLFTNAREMIHIKRYGGSAVLSHLFMQGTQSAELYVTEPGFRTKVNELLPKSHRLDPKPRPDTAAHTVVFGVVSHQTGSEITLPFFSRLTLRQAARRIRGFGYNVALAKIHVRDEVAKKKRYKPKMSKKG